MAKKNVIWSSEINLEDWKYFIDENCPNESEYEQYRLISEENEMYLEDERANLSTVQLNDDVIVIADLGLWNGHHSGYRELKHVKNAGELLHSFVNGVSEITWYVDGYGNLWADETHHDGTNHYLYREWKPGVNREILLDRLYTGNATKSDISRFTTSIGKKIARVYGW